MVLWKSDKHWVHTEVEKKGKRKPNHREPSIVLWKTHFNSSSFQNVATSMPWVILHKRTIEVYVNLVHSAKSSGSFHKWATSTSKRLHCSVVESEATLVPVIFPLLCDILWTWVGLLPYNTSIFRQFRCNQRSSLVISDGSSGERPGWMSLFWFGCGAVQWVPPSGSDIHSHRWDMVVSGTKGCRPNDKSIWV